MADNIDGIIERIKKAVRLANKTTEAGERETAMRLAKNLAEKNGIAFDEIAVDEESVCKAQRAQEGRCGEPLPRLYVVGSGVAESPLRERCAEGWRIAGASPDRAECVSEDFPARQFGGRDKQETTRHEDQEQYHGRGALGFGQ